MPIEPSSRPASGCRLSDLADLVASLGFTGHLTGPGGQPITGVSADSRTVQPGDLYAALPGANHHGGHFVSEAVARGAVAILTDLAGADQASRAGLATLVTTDPRGVLGDLSASVYGHPARALRSLAVTGTNGKTTVTYLADAALRASGHTTGMIGTVETRVGSEVMASVRTTPEATDVQRTLARMVDQACTAVSMEVSSHALALGRVNGITFDVALFTNLSQDHLDFHHTLEEYFLAKAELFTSQRARHAVIDIDDEWGERLLRLTDLPTTTFSTRGGPADWGVSDLVLDALGSTFTAVGPAGQGVDVEVAMPGPFNVSNALAAMVSTMALGCSAEDAAHGIAGLAGVPGRMERIDVGQGFLALVDYAHTPDAVANVLESVRATVSGPVIVVLGCGGDRDTHKRPAMGAAAVQGSDLAILTSDNPRSEDPASIIAAMRHGADRVAVDRSQILVEPDRAEAIREAVRRAVDGGAVVVAGKGHETGQEIAGTVLSFDDRVVLRAALLGEADPAGWS